MLTQQHLRTSYNPKRRNEQAIKKESTKINNNLTSHSTIKLGTFDPSDCVADCQITIIR